MPLPKPASDYEEDAINAKIAAARPKTKSGKSFKNLLARTKSSSAGMARMLTRSFTRKPRASGSSDGSRRSKTRSLLRGFTFKSTRSLFGNSTRSSEDVHDIHDHSNTSDGEEERWRASHGVPGETEDAPADEGAPKKKSGGKKASFADANDMTA